MLKKALALGVKGACIGVANVIPGVSGGTVALLLGIYHELAEAVGGMLGAGWKKRLEYARFLLPVFLGAGLSILIFSRGVEWLYERFPEQLGFFFLGLVAASLPALLRELKGRPRAGSWLLFGLGFALTLGLGLMDRLLPAAEAAGGALPALSPAYAAKLFASGAAAAAAMVAPGISGSFLLMLMGEYYHILGFINAMALPALLVFGTGVVVGLVGAARLISALLSRYFEATMMCIVGLVVASLYVVWPGLTAAPLPLAMDLLAFCLGAALVLGFSKPR